jgi:hypothetical protein
VGKSGDWAGSAGGAGGAAAPPPNPARCPDRPARAPATAYDSATDSVEEVKWSSSSPRKRSTGSSSR